MPGLAKTDSGIYAEEKQERENGSGGGGEPPAIDPIIGGLLKRLPPSGETWPKAQRKLWLQLLEGSFDLIYKDSDGKQEVDWDK